MSKGVGFQLVNITTEEFATNKIELKGKEEIDIGVGINFGLNAEIKGIACFASFQFLQDDIPFIILKLRCEFLIEESAWNDFLYKSKKRIKFPKGFLQHLAVLTIGTARGVIHSRTENTAMNQFYLPTVNVMDFVSEDEVFEIQK